jgi:DNA-binding CsgD family transcriptional regulator
MIDAEVLDALYRGAADSSELERALELLADMFACRSATLISLDLQASATDMVLSTGLWDAAVRERYMRDFAAFDPAPQAFARMRVGTASTTDRILTAEQLRQGAFVNELYRPLGLAETLGGMLRSDQGRFEMIGLQRGPDRPPFEDDEIARVERLMPHVARALQLRRAFLEIETKTAGLQAAVERLLVGMVLLDPVGTSVFVNGARRAIANRADGLSLDRAGRPLPASIEARQQLDALLHAVTRGGAGGTLAVPRSSGLRPYAVLAAPAPSSLTQGRPWGRHGANCALVLVHDPAGRSITDADVLQKGLGLTAGAARLVAALAGEDDLKSFAEREGVTIHTARFHLRTALARTGARSQAELVRLAVRLLRDFGLGESDTPALRKDW